MCEETGPLAERGQSADAAPPLPPSPFNFVCLHFPPKQNHPEVIYFKARPPTDGAPQGGAGGGPLRAASTAPPPPPQGAAPAHGAEWGCGIPGVGKRVQKLRGTALTAIP